jgi:hypothetical protein
MTPDSNREAGGPLAPDRTTKIIVGQRVVCRRTSRVGQVLGVASPSELCTVRYSDSGEVETTHARELRLASWADLRDRNNVAGSETPTRVVKKLDDDPDKHPDQSEADTTSNN